MNPLAVIGVNAQDPARRNGQSILSTFRIPVYNAGSAIAANKLVALSGYQASPGRPKVVLADADDPTLQAVAITDHAIPASSSSYVVLEAVVGGLVTNGGSVGDPVYTSATAGGWTLSAPTGDRFKQSVGRIKVSSATVGVIHFQLYAAHLEKVGAGFLQTGSGAVDATLIQYATVAITDAQMKTLRASAVTLVAAPAAGSVHEFVSAKLYFDYTAAYTETADNMAVKYTDGSGTQVSETIEATGFVDAVVDTATSAIAKADVIVAKTACDAKALVLHNTGDGEYGGGNASNVIRVMVAYRTHAAGW